MSDVEMIYVKSNTGDDRVAIWDVNPEHPEDGEAFVAGCGEGVKPVQVAKTGEIERALRKGTIVEVSGPSKAAKAKATKEEEEKKEEKKGEATPPVTPPTPPPASVTVNAVKSPQAGAPVTSH